MNILDTIAKMPDMKGRLSALWLITIRIYTYGDTVTLKHPLKQGSVRLTEELLLGDSIFTIIPITIVLQTGMLEYRASRLMRIISGVIMKVTLPATLLFQSLQCIISFLPLPKQHPLHL